MLFGRGELSMTELSSPLASSRQPHAHARTQPGSHQATSGHARATSGHVRVTLGSQGAVPAPFLGHAPARRRSPSRRRPQREAYCRQVVVGRVGPRRSVLRTAARPPARPGLPDRYSWRRHRPTTTDDRRRRQNGPGRDGDGSQPCGILFS